MLTIAFIRVEARPVTVMHPATRPATPHATDTVIAPLAPLSRVSIILS